MNYVERTFAPSEVAELSGISQDNLRDWRRRGFLDGIGEQDGVGRWRYSFHEIITIAVLRILERSGASMLDLFYMASRSVFYVIDRVRNGNEYNGFGGRFHVFWKDDTLQLRFMATGSTENLTAPHAPFFLVVDNDRVAEEIPVQMRDVILRGKVSD